MTREEAIKWLEYSKQGEIGKAVEAADMAIKALEAEPCEDAISITAVKKAAKEMYLEVANSTIDDSTTSKSDIISLIASRCRNTLLKIIVSLPPVTPERPRGHWKKRKSWNYYVCDKCSYESEKDSHYCPNCGCCMIEPQESEE